MRSSAKVQAVAAVALAAVLWGAWALFGTPVKVRWLVARGAPPASPSAGRKSADAIRAAGAAARPSLLSLLNDRSSSRARKSWVATVLLRGPYFAQAEVEKSLASDHPATARAAAFALMDGEEDALSFEESASQAEAGPAVRAGRAPVESWDPAPAIPVLVSWLADAEDPEARFAARLLGKIPPGDPRIRGALLAVVEEVPRVAARDAPPALRERRKPVVVDCLQSLLAWARQDPEVVGRVARMVAWIEQQGDSLKNWDIQAYALRLFELAGGRGVDPALLVTLSRSPNAVVRQKLAATLETVPGRESGRILEELLGDEVAVVRRAAVLCLRKRRDPLLLDLAPYLVEDSDVFIRADTLRSLGELRGVAPERCREALPLLVACLEEPWPGPAVEPGTPRAAQFASATAEVVESCALSLQMIAQQSPGFEKDAILDWKKRAETAQRLAREPALRKEVADEWRRSVPAWPEANRIPPLVRRLEDRDPDNVVRAARELVRLAGDGPGFPERVLKRGRDDTDARNAVRELRKSGEWPKIVEAWKARGAR